SALSIQVVTPLTQSVVASKVALVSVIVEPVEVPLFQLLELEEAAELADKSTAAMAVLLFESFFSSPNCLQEK
ncbi:MAG TPA: hypothetical protein PLP72_24925, partial [Leptospiraceae bacterium]|nr:hypothetical protein [Leptospiraceae bacterium]